MEFDKKSLSERDICTKYITPAIVQTAGWDLHTQIREEVTFTAGRVYVRGKLVTRGESKRADYILYYKPNIKIAVIEAKDNNHSFGSGMQQALNYAEILDIPFVYSCNGDAFLEHDRTVTSGIMAREIPLDSFPTPAELWQRYCQWKNIDDQLQPIVTQSYYDDGSGKFPRYYQEIAINKTVEAIAKGENRILLVMATGTGKTFTAFQIIWRLWKSKIKTRILFLADRNILIDQTKTNDFKPFGSAMTKITKRQVDKSYEIYLALYQGVSGTEESKNIYKQFSRGFFDLIVIDECHRGSAADDSAWREILEYFTAATQIGLTATPKETKEVSNIDYFGEPIYIYSLKQGIEDGFLAPYKVVRIDIDKDLEGWQPAPGELDKYNQLIEDKLYTQKDINRTLVLENRDILVAKKITEFLKATNRFDKTIVFCEDIDHAERMRCALINENSDLVSQNRKYIMRITGDDEQGKAELDNFILPESPYPVIVTTSKLMTTGIDAQTCKLIVLDKDINSPTEFKQIIGRGTRINEEFDKKYFTIIDFKKATKKFDDPDFDGEPVQIYEPKTGQSPVPPDDYDGSPDSGDNVDDLPEKPGQKRVKFVPVGVDAAIISERTLYYGKDGKLITESIKDYTRKTVQQEFTTLDKFLRRWSAAAQKQAIIQELNEQGILLEALAEEVGKDFDPFDLICHVAFDQPALSRKERAKKVRERDYFHQYSQKARAVIDALLDKYADEGIENIEHLNILNVQPFDKIGTLPEIVNKIFGSKQKYLEALQELKNQLYMAS
ncbi:MAG: DEAD/DEAH box helicase family protein [Dolichospermum sp. DET50]|nr:DEAD/DEAH box helicase family protein [Dolichospermum sp. DET66]MBS3035397.1 DEAD/DEAH box helicase family protein [Dolichospermum sp. DET67]MBS3040599.1 DEAD/DEAH box helicase family protein [Dolichospermum sp. DET50]QSX67730.1 MAG: DEAD/DEAH box helicase family protein [Dolichospermum sp. DET69]